MTSFQRDDSSRYLDVHRSGRASERNGGSQCCPASGWADNVEVAAKCCDTVLESDESRPTTDHCAPDPVVDDRQMQTSVRDAYADGDFGCAGVLCGICQGFCHDVVRSDFNLFRHPGFHADIKFNGYC